MGDAVPPSPLRRDAALLIESGPHAGVRVSLGAQPCRVGRDAGNDVVLMDDLLAATHFVLARREGGFQIQAAGGPVAVHGAVLEAGRAAPCADGERFEAGGTSFQFAGPDVPAAAPPRLMTLRAKVTVFAAGAACTAIALVAMGSAAVPPALQAGMAAPAAMPVPTPRPLTPVEVAGRVSEHLAAEGLGTIVLAALPDGSVEAAGEIMTQQAGAWRQAQRWFDADFAGRAVLVDHVAVTTAAPPLAIQAVWPGANPYVMDASGQKLFAGAALRSGWSVERILADRVVIRRGAQLVAVRF